MSEMKHTPGPWTADAQNNRVTGPLGVSIAACSTAMLFSAEGTYYITARDAKANAHLIAAAPELLAALKAMVSFQFDGGNIAALILAAEVAIAKAEGR